MRQQSDAFNIFKAQFKELMQEQVKMPNTIGLLTDKFLKKLAHRPRFQPNLTAQDALEMFRQLETHAAKLHLLLSKYDFMAEMVQTLHRPWIEAQRVIAAVCEYYERESHDQIQQFTRFRQARVLPGKDICVRCENRLQEQEVHLAKNRILNHNFNDHLGYFEEATHIQEDQEGSLSLLREEQSQLQSRLNELAGSFQAEQRCIRDIIEEMNNRGESLGQLRAQSTHSKNTGDDSSSEKNLRKLVRSVFTCVRKGNEIKKVDCKHQQSQTQWNKNTLEEHQLQLCQLQNQVKELNTQKQRLQVKLSQEEGQRHEQIQRLQKTIGQLIQQKRERGVQLNLLQQDNLAVTQKNTELMVDMAKLRPLVKPFKKSIMEKTKIQKNLEQSNDNQQKDGSGNIEDIVNPLTEYKNNQTTQMRNKAANNFSGYSLLAKISKLSFIQPARARRTDIQQDRKSPSELSIDHGDSTKAYQENVNYDLPAIKSPFLLSQLEIEPPKEDNHRRQQYEISASYKSLSGGSLSLSRKEKKARTEVTGLRQLERLLSRKGLPKVGEQFRKSTWMKLQNKEINHSVVKQKSRQDILRQLWQREVKQNQDQKQNLKFDQFRQIYQKSMVKAFQKQSPRKQKLSRHLMKKNSASLKQLLRQEGQQIRKDNKQKKTQLKVIDQSQAGLGEDVINQISLEIFPKLEATESLNNSMVKGAREKREVMCLFGGEFQMMTELLAYLAELRVHNFAAYEQIRELIVGEIPSCRGQDGINQLKAGLGKMLRMHRKCNKNAPKIACRHLINFADRLIRLIKI